MPTKWRRSSGIARRASSFDSACGSAAPEARAKTPMPPETALRRFKLADAAWRDGGALSGLILSVNERLRAEDGTRRQGDALLRQSYESLRACLPDESAATLPERQAPDNKPSRHTATLDRMRAEP